MPPNAPGGGPIVGVANGDPRATSPTPAEDVRASATKVCVGMHSPEASPVPTPPVNHTKTMKAHQPLSRKRTPTSL